MARMSTFGAVFYDARPPVCCGKHVCGGIWRNPVRGNVTALLQHQRGRAAILMTGTGVVGEPEQSESRDEMQQSIESVAGGTVGDVRVGRGG